MSSPILPSSTPIVSTNNPPTDLPPSLPPPPVHPVTPTVLATEIVAIPIVNKPPVQPKTPLRERKVKPFSLGKQWERFCRFFKNAFKGSLSTPSSSSVAPFVTEVVPLKRFDPFDLWPKKPVVTQGGQVQKTNSPPRVIETPAKVRNELPAKLTDLSKALRGKITLSAVIQNPKPQVNITGNNCFMNSSLQTLENCYLQYDKNCQALLDKDLTKLPNETLKAFEKRVLHTWAPINDASDVDLAQLEGEVQELEVALSQLGADQPVEKRKIKERIALCKDTVRQINNQDLAGYNDRVLFKLSYLLVLQAKKYGTSDQVTEALKRHHEAAFMLDAPYMQFIERRQQLDASFYLMLWHETLGIGNYQSSFRQAVLNNEVYKSDHPAVEKYPLIKTNLRNDKGVNASSLVEVIDRYFSDTVQNSVQKANLTQQLESKQKELDETSAFNLVKRKNLETEIGKIKTAFVQIAGGEFTRPNGTIGRMDANVWKPGNDLIFDDWTTDKLIINSPPEFLQVALDRFYANRDQSQQFKIADKIPFNRDSNGNPIGSFTDPIDLSSRFSPESLQAEGATYELIGIVQHLGSGINGGHYVSYVKRGDQWFYTSDSTVNPCDIKNVPFDNCSVLSYRRL